MSSQSAAPVYVIDQVAVRRAAAFLGLLVPVRVRRCRMWGWGRYCFITGGYHRISLARDLDVAQASRTLWHELTHARQLEQHGRDPWAFDAGYHAGLPPRPPERSRAFDAWFDACPFEREAMAAYRHHDWLPLTKGAP